MRAEKLKKKYPEIWDEVYNNVFQDLEIALPICHSEELNTVRKQRIAHNAAFFACDAVHHEIRRNHLKLIK